MGLYSHLVEWFAESPYGIVRVFTCHEVHLFESASVGLHTGKTSHVDDGRSDAFELVFAWLELSRRLPHVSIDETELNFLFHNDNV